MATCSCLSFVDDYVRITSTAVLAGKILHTTLLENVWQRPDYSVHVYLAADADKSADAENSSRKKLALDLDIFVSMWCLGTLSVLT